MTDDIMTEGVLVAKKDFNSKHGDIDTKNLYVSLSLAKIGLTF